MKKSKFKKIFIVFSLCVFLLSLFSVSSFALNISDVHTGYLYEFTGSKSTEGSLPGTGGSLQVSGYVVDKSSGNMTAFESLYFTIVTGSSSSGSVSSWGIGAGSSSSDVSYIFNSASGSNDKIYIDFTNNSKSKSDFESFLDSHWSYTVTPLDDLVPLFDKANIALSGGTNSEGVAYDGLLGMVSKFGKFLVSSPLLLVLCIALPLVSFSVGLIIRIKNRA